VTQSRGIMMGGLKLALPGLLLLLTGHALQAQIGASPEQSIALYGKPERDGMKESGLLYFRKEGLCHIAHYQEGRCDVLSIFSDRMDMGVPVELDEEKIKQLLKTEGGATEWIFTRYAINRLWNSRDGTSFAIYDTMRHKLVIMTHAAYRREKEELKKVRPEVR
jgi:hypothetical protein